MLRDPRAHLWDAREAALAIQTFVEGMDGAGYSNNLLVQAAVERKFEIVGEALGRLCKADASLAARVPDVARIAAF